VSRSGLHCVITTIITIAPDVHMSCRDSFWYWESVVLVQTLGLVAAQVFASSLDGFFQLTIMLVILVAGALALAHCHPFEQDGPQIVQVCTVMVESQTSIGAIHICSCFTSKILPC